VARLDKSSDKKSEIDLYRKRCGVNLVLLRFDNAAEDLSQAICLHVRSASSPSLSDLANVSAINAWLLNHSTEDPQEIVSGLPRPLKELTKRIKFDVGMHQTTPDYDLSHIYSSIGPLSVHVNAASYTSDTEIKQTAQHGRSLFASRAFKTGDLIMAEKAFAIPAHFSNDPSNVCSLYSLGDGTATDNTGALLFKELVKKLTYNPSLRKEFFEMNDGGYWEKHGWQISDEDSIPIDVYVPLDPLSTISQ
jgi:hypothetical protein